MDIYHYLKNDHDKVNALFQQILATEDRKKRQELFNEVKQELLLHAQTEEQTFYQALKDKANIVIKHAINEHQEMKNKLTAVEQLSSDDQAWLNRFKELQEVVQHHVTEEEGKIFQQAKTILSEDQANSLVAEMSALKDKTLQEQVAQAENS